MGLREIMYRSASECSSQLSLLIHKQIPRPRSNSTTEIGKSAHKYLISIVKTPYLSDNM